MAPERTVRVSIPVGKYPPQFTGQGIQIKRSLPYLVARGVDPTILAYRLPAAFGPPPADGPGKVDRVLTAGAGRLSTLLRILQFRKYFRGHGAGFDVLHCDLLGWEFLMNIRYLKALGLPIIMEMLLLGGDDPLTLSQERFGAFKRRLLDHVDVWLGLSGAFFPRVLAAGIPGEKFRLVYPGVDLDAYRPLTPEERRATRARLGLPGDARIVMSVGSVIRRKGVDRLLRAWERLRPRHGRDLLVIVGPATAAEGLEGDDLTFAEAARESSRAPTLDGTVLWVGRRDNINDYLGAANLFLFLSRQEGLGIVILEALACGLPCILSPLDGIASEIVSDGGTGMIIKDPDDDAAVAEAVAHLLDRPDARRAMGEASRKTAVQRFTFDARADALAAIYRDLATRARRPYATL